jgi:hypothetical protein
MSFASASALSETSPGRFRGDVDPAWTIGGKPNGGYLLAMLGRAVTLVGPHPHVVATSAHFLTAPEPGPVQVHAQVLRGGRRTSQLRAWLAQQGTPCVEALFTTSQFAPSEAFWNGGVPDAPTAPREQCVRVPSQAPNGLRVALMDEVDLRLDEATTGFARGAPSGTGELRGWLALPGEDFDHLSLIFAVDALPPATFEVAMTGWVPTLEMTAYVRALPAPGPVRVLQKARLIEGERFDEACFVWDSNGKLVAQATQLAGIRVVG